MRRRLIVIGFLCISAAAQSAYAQQVSGISDGTAFANSINPTTPGTIVNPAAVSSAAWSNTAVPTSTPSGLGAFSNPINDKSVYNSAASLGLTGIGLQTQADCANYVPGTNAQQNQQCAAVNFMSNNCLPPTAPERAVLGNVPIATAGAGNCAGTYGQGLSQFNFGNQITASDPVFTSINNAQAAAALNGNTVCVPQTVVVTPAQYATNTCVSSSTTTALGCSQNLNESVITTYSCPSGVSVSALAPSGKFSVIFGCTNPPIATVTVSINGAFQCHSGLCNSNYYPLTLQFTTGQDATITRFLSQTYRGWQQEITTIKYVAALNQIQITDAENTPTLSCPTGTNAGHMTTSQWVPTPVYTPYLATMSTWMSSSQVNVCVPTSTCPPGTIGTRQVNSIFGGTTNVPYQITDQTGAQINVCVAAPSCPSNMSGPYLLTLYEAPSFWNQNQIPQSIYVCGAANYAVVPVNSCFDGRTPINGVCINKTVQTSWTDTCATYETNAGIVLPKP